VAVERMFAVAERDFGVPELVVFNAGYRARGSILDIDPAEAEAALRNNALAGFLVGQGAARAMVPAGKGSIFFTGATAGIKGFAGSSPFAMGKFALRGLAQSMARELGPKGIHVAHFIIDGGIAGTRGAREANEDDVLLSPQAIAETYLAVHKQHRSAWTQEIDLRPWNERF
jgi:NAD(P)-dependent dehydrogenase (short-subunit alcohol dehydrogenase family)